MPRLRDRKVLDEGVLDLPMLWPTDAFALATGFDEGAGRYIGLWIPDDTISAPPPTDTLLLVRPDIATEQRDREEQAEPPEPPPMTMSTSMNRPTWPAC